MPALAALLGPAAVVPAAELAFGGGDPVRDGGHAPATTPVNAESGLSLSTGTFAVQNHDPRSVFDFRHVRLTPPE